MNATITEMHERKTPETFDEAVELMRWFSEQWDGGFHPDDNPAEIISARNGEPVFATEADQAEYRRLADTAYRLIAGDESGVDIYEIALIGHTDENPCLWRNGACLNWTHSHDADDAPHTGHYSRLGGTWWCDTCNSPYCELA